MSSSTMEVERKNHHLHNGCHQFFGLWNRFLLNTHSTLKGFSSTGAEGFCRFLKAVTARCDHEKFQGSFEMNNLFPHLKEINLSEALPLVFSNSSLEVSMGHSFSSTSFRRRDSANSTATEADIPYFESALGRIAFINRYRGPAFLGQVFTLYDGAGRAPGFIRRTAAPSSLNPPNIMNPFSRVAEWVKRLVQEEVEDTSIRFFFEESDAVSHVKRLRLHGVDCKVGPYPLDAAYQLSKDSGICRFIADHNQVKVARKLLRKNHQGKDRQLKGVPVFCVENVRYAMAIPGGVRWFTPYFFKKENLDAFIAVGVDNYFRSQISARRSRRHKPFVKDESSGDAIEEHQENILDSPEVDDFLSDAEHDGIALDSLLVKAAQVQIQDWVDELVLGNHWTRKLMGIQPSFSVNVDFFEQRAAASENDPQRMLEQDLAVKQTNETDALQQNFVSGKLNETKENTLSSLRSLKSVAEHTAGTREAADNKPRIIGARSGIDASKQEVPSVQDQFLGILLNANLDGIKDEQVQQALTSAAKDVQDRLKKGEGKFERRDPLFIADMSYDFKVYRS